MKLAKAFPGRAFVFTNAWACIVCVERFPLGNSQTGDCLRGKQLRNRPLAKNSKPSDPVQGPLPGQKMGPGGLQLRIRGHGRIIQADI
jgi:hypothetical protein